ncbi:hypothetical protein HYPSUDRAFT_205648 [Hypholoma sublateritium FD-334 SS-4]|uniref:Uncharacterized protein n=1 Tax=Hypholoma sublateritium (strain FD-334 SS-4) TaxID=945553 RepID=A0A0D2PD65_HYPSF|nr:hypothetical protein HYPSUDRAFT_205648 [Hypholoma sublateritium FD-334 SS-4]
MHADGTCSTLTSRSATPPRAHYISRPAIRACARTRTQRHLYASRSLCPSTLCKGRRLDHARVLPVPRVCCEHHIVLDDSAPPARRLRPELNPGLCFTTRGHGSYIYRRETVARGVHHASTFNDDTTPLPWLALRDWCMARVWPICMCALEGKSPLL